MKRLAAFLAVAIGLSTFSACGGGRVETHGENGINIYRIASVSGMEYLAPRWLETPKEAGTDQLIALVSQALFAAEGEDGQSPVPSNVSMDITRSGSVAYVDFGAGFAQLSAGRSILATAAVALSLLEAEGISYVYLTIEGEYYTPFYDRAATALSFATEEYAGVQFGRQ